MVAISSTRSFLGALLAIWLIVGGAHALSQSRSVDTDQSGLKPIDPTAVDPKQIDAVEDLSESLANDLLALSIATRDKDRQTIERYLADELTATPLPETPTPTERRLKWVLAHGWQGVGRVATVTRRGRFVERLERLLEHFDSIEDARFKVDGAQFEPGPVLRGVAQVRFYIVGRDLKGRREWLNGRARIEAGKSADSVWRIRRFELESMTSLLSERELFSEVALPAGVHTSFPAFGTTPNDTVIAHGAAVADIDRDGLLDLVTTGVEQNHAFLNDGKGGFRDVSSETLVGLSPVATGALFVDYDNDGDADLFLATVGEQLLLENRLVPDGEVRFLDGSLAAGVAIPGVGFSAVAADVNGDGWQDIYVASYNRYGIVMPNSWIRATNGTPNLLFLNQTDGTFREAAEAWGVRDSRWSYAAGFADIDADGDQDLYVANDFGENGLFINEGGRFQEAAANRGVLDPGNGMGVAFGDYDNDGDLDLHVTNMSSTAGNRILSRLYPEAGRQDLLLKKLAAGNSLFENDGRGGFRDVSAAVGGLSAGWAFGGGFVDFDNDGWEDIYSPNGFISGKTMNDT